LGRAGARTRSVLRGDPAAAARRLRRDRRGRAPPGARARDRADRGRARQGRDARGVAAPDRAGARDDARVARRTPLRGPADRLEQAVRGAWSRDQPAELSVAARALLDRGADARTAVQAAGIPSRELAGRIAGERAESDA